MPYFVVTLKDRQRSRFAVVTLGNNTTDAVLTAYKLWAGDDRYNDGYEEHGSGNAFAEALLADVFDCTEIYRAMVLEYVERRLDGDRDINIIL